jgi:two-component sensor histidine kinase
MPRVLRVLILEDRLADAELMLHELRQAGFDPDWQRAETADQFAALLEWSPDLILADYTLPQFDALRALNFLQGRGLDIPFVIVTGSLSEETAVECMKEGATDYLLKDRLTRLGPAVARALELKCFRDERKRNEERIRASLREKEVLLKEVQHRVKNNLQVITSLLSLQSGYIKDELARQMLQESQNRIRAMALVHQRIYHSQDLARISFNPYIRELATQLFHSFGVQQGSIALQTSDQDICLAVDTAIPCALIINELVSNSLKHAFPAGRKGAVCIDLRSEDGQFTLTVKDDGVGLPKTVKLPSPHSLGWQLVSALTEQLDGDLKVGNGCGTSVRITFRELKYKGRE